MILKESSGNGKGSGFSCKGQAVVDLLFLVILLIGMTVIGVVLFSIYGETNDLVQGDANIEPEIKAVQQTATETVPKTWDYGFLFALVIGWIALIASSFKIDSNPAFFVISFILLIFVFYIGAITANVWGEIGDASAGLLDNPTVDFPIINWVYNHFIPILIAIGSTTLWALFGRPE